MYISGERVEWEGGEGCVWVGEVVAAGQHQCLVG